MRIALIVEGKTEQAFLPALRAFLETRLAGRMPKIDPVPQDGPLPKGEKLQRLVNHLLSDSMRRADKVIGLTDAYTGRRDFEDGDDAVYKIKEWAGHEPRFYAHAAQFEFEAWLLPYWDRIQRLAGSASSAPSNKPESVNHVNPPSTRIKEVFRAGSKGRAYVKTRDAARILEGADLTVSADACPRLRAFLNTILRLCGGIEL